MQKRSLRRNPPSIRTNKLPSHQMVNHQRPKTVPQLIQRILLARILSQKNGCPLPWCFPGISRPFHRDDSRQPRWEVIHVNTFCLSRKQQKRRRYSLPPCPRWQTSILSTPVLILIINCESAFAWSHSPQIHTIFPCTQIKAISQTITPHDEINIRSCSTKRPWYNRENREGKSLAVDCNRKRFVA